MQTGKVRGSMSSIAILAGNTIYEHQNELACCHDDLLAMHELLSATEKYTQIFVIENSSSTELKAQLRKIMDDHHNPEELLFYFTGHGDNQKSDFYFCSTNYDSKRPNETGLSNTELHTLLRLAEADLVVKVVDACNSGTLLIKSDEGIGSLQFTAEQKSGFRNLIQISSCLDSQNSLTGNPVSMFTESFRAACLRKMEGVVYYTDIISGLRDEYLQNNDQTPLYVSQGTGREQFTDNAKRLDGLRSKLTAATSSFPAEVSQLVPTKPTLKDMLQRAEEHMVTPEQVTKFVNGFFASVTQGILASEFADFFEISIVEHAEFREPTARSFMIRTLSKEERPDRFVRAEIRREKKRDPLAFAAISAMSFLTNADYTEVYELELNCLLEKAQIKIALTPKYRSLKEIILVISCAPSLERCYIFEIGTQHRLVDFDKYDAEGAEIVRRWYKVAWSDNTISLAEKISTKLTEVVRAHLEATEERLGIQNK